MKTQYIKLQDINREQMLKEAKKAKKRLEARMKQIKN